MIASAVYKVHSDSENEKLVAPEIQALPHLSLLIYLLV